MSVPERAVNADALIVPDIREAGDPRPAEGATSQPAFSAERTATQRAPSLEDPRVVAETASHDLQAPLRQVLQFLTLIERRSHSELNPQAREHLRCAIDAAGRAQAMTRDFMSYWLVGCGEGPRDPVPLDNVLAGVLDGLRRRLSDARAVLTHQPLPVVTGDRAQLALLLQTLIVNAIVHHDGPAPRIEIAAHDAGDGHVVSVTDDGPGIDPSDHERVFRLFQRVAVAGAPGGSGAGLAICRSIVERHGGRIWIDSTPGHGCTVAFVLPATDRRGTQQ